jgi:uncharacterized protein (TIGR02231 family)
MSTLVISLLLSSLGAPDRVVVFPDRAQVTRVAPVTCGTRAPLVFTELPPAVDPASLRARITEGTIDGLRTEKRTHEKEFGPKAAALQQQLEALQLELEAASDQATRLAMQKQTSARYADTAVTLASREMTQEKPDVKAWGAAFDTSLSSSLAARRGEAENSAHQRELGRRRDFLQRELQLANVGRQKFGYEVEVLATCPAGHTAQVELSYLVGASSWVPAYEARADESQGQVELTTWATLSQGTGEAWKDVELTLSTAVPSENATPPELQKLFVNATEKAAEKKVLVRRDELVSHASGGKNDSDARGGGLTARNQGLSVQLTVPERALVPGDGNAVRLFVGKAKLKASFELRATPQLVPAAFRVAELTNTGAWPLLPGRLDAFRRAGLVGRYALERVPQGGAFTLTFGIEDGVRVKRVTLEELKRDPGFLGTKRRFTYAYRFELANYGGAPIELSVAEHVPVAEVDDIAVTVDEKTTPGYQLGKDDGIAKWKVPLKAGEQKSVVLAFKVEVPDSYDTGGL